MKLFWGVISIDFKCVTLFPCLSFFHNFQYFSMFYCRRGRGFESRRFDSLAGAPENPLFIGFSGVFRFFSLYRKSSCQWLNFIFFGTLHKTLHKIFLNLAENRQPTPEQVSWLFFKGSKKYQKIRSQRCAFKISCFIQMNMLY